MLGACKKQPKPIVIVPDIEKNHLQNNRIFGKVKQLDTQTFYILSDSLPVSDTITILSKISSLIPNISDVQCYTSDGYLLHYVKFSANEDTLLKRNYFYSKNAKIEHWEEYDSTNSLKIKGVYSYDRNNFISEETIYQNDSVVMNFKHSTDGIGNIIRTIQSFGNYSTKVEYKYDENGLVSELVEYEPNGKVFKNAKIEYDNYGDEVNRCVYKSGNQMIEYTYTKYDQMGRCKQTIFEDRLHNVKEFHYFFNFDDFNNWQYEVCSIEGIVVYVRKRNLIYYTDL